MRLTVFGATGRTGQPLVRQALAEGHEVVVLVRDPAKLGLQDERLTVIKGDVLNGEDVEGAVRGSDAILSALGQSKGSPADMQTVATRHIVAAMKKHGINRLVSLTGAGVDAPEDQPKVINHIIKFALKTLSGQVLRDAQEHVKVLRESGLDWVVVRGPMLTEGPFTGKYRVGWVGVNTSARIARADVADFMLKQVKDTNYVHKMPMVSD